MSSTSTDPRIIMNFAWEGTSVWSGGISQGGLAVKVIDLIFEGATTQISVHLRDAIQAGETRQLSFTCRKEHRETTPELLRVKIDQIRNLTINAGVFEKSSYQGTRTMDRLGNVHVEERVCRSNRNVELELPQELEAEQTYCLRIISDDLALRAVLVKEEVVQTAPSISDSDRKEACELLQQMLSGLIGMKLMEFNMHWQQSSHAQMMTDMTSINMPLIASQAIHVEVQKIEPSTIVELRTIKSQWDIAPQPQKKDLETRYFRRAFQSMDADGLKNIMRSCIKACFGSQAVPQGSSTMVEALCARFQEICVTKVAENR